MSDMIERVAKAIRQTLMPMRIIRTEELARAAIEAMREPTLSMVHAGAWAGPFTIDRYMAMIDTALSQDTHSPSPLNPPADEEGAAASSQEQKP